MAGKTYDLTPKDVKPVKTTYRRISTRFPVPESIPILENLRKYEPVSMSGQPPVVWDRAEGVQVYDKWGNMWLDWSSGVLVTSAGHGRQEIRQAVIAQVEHGLLHNYCFPSEMRARLAEKLVACAPDKLDKAFILTTGSEAVECALKLARTYAVQKHGWHKTVMVSFNRSFHGRTLGSQLAGGIPALKTWIREPRVVPVGAGEGGGWQERPERALADQFVQVPFPDGFRTEDTSFDLFERSLAEQGVDPNQVCGVITETYQGGGASFAPKEYMQQLARWCAEHDALLIFDEIQAGFGRTGTFWGFEHYDVVPDLMTLGKALSGSLPISAVVGRADVMNLYGPGEMTSTHTGNPVCAAAALASIDLIEKENLVENARAMGEVLQGELDKLRRKYPQVIGARHGRGLVAGLHMVKSGSKEPDGDLAFRVVANCARKGLLMFSPVGFGGGTVKVSPPLVIGEEAIMDGIAALDEAIAEAL